MNVIVQLEFKLAYNNVAIHYAMETPLHAGKIFYQIYDQLFNVLAS